MNAVRSGATIDQHAKHAEARNKGAILLCREGLDGKSCSALTSKGLASANEATNRKLRTLHPSAPPPGHSPTDSLALPPDLPPELVAKMLRSFPKGTAPGPSGLRAQHLVDALTPANKASVVQQLANVCSVLARGAAPRVLAPFLAGAKLFAADKKRRTVESGQLPPARSYGASTPSVCAIPLKTRLGPCCGRCKSAADLPWAPKLRYTPCVTGALVTRVRTKSS